MNAGYVVKGADALASTPDALLAAIHGDPARRSVRRAARYMVQRFREIVPVDTGALRDSVEIVDEPNLPNRTSSLVQIERDRLVELRRARGGRVAQRNDDADAFYAVYVEFESGVYPLRKAAEETAQRFRGEFVQEVRQAVSNTAATEGTG